MTQYKVGVSFHFGFYSSQSLHNVEQNHCPELLFFYTAGHLNVTDWLFIIELSSLLDDLPDWVCATSVVLRRPTKANW